MQPALAIVALIVAVAADEQCSFNKDAILKDAESCKDWITTNRRTLHRQPELLYDLQKTEAFITTQLDELSVQYERGIAKTGVVATIGTGNPPCVGLRADMDALPIFEEVHPEFRSQTDGKMHACGHDAHTAMLLGAAKMLKRREAELQGTVKLIFQPAEEGGAGALAMLQEGLLARGPPISSMLGMHVWPALPTGTIATRSGTLMAAMGFFEVSFRGKGGHGAMPHQTVDPITAAAQAISALQTIVSREVDATDAAVVSVTLLQGGSAFNVIPDTVRIGGTIRALRKEQYQYLERRVRDILHAVATSSRCELVDISFTTFDASCLTTPKGGMPGGCTYPPVVNDDAVSARALRVASMMFGEAQLRNVSVTMGGEDFAYFAEKVPSTFIVLGSGNAAKNSTYGLHSPKFQLDEDVLPIGAAIHTAFALQSLAV